MEWLYDIVGRDSATIEWWQMAIRAAVIFLYLLVLVRLAGCRAFGAWTPFDIVLGILLGSTLSRTLTANAPLLPTMAAGAVLVAMHVLLAKLALRFESISFLAKGRERQVVENGRMLHRNMRRCRITEADLRENLRGTLQTGDLEQVDCAYLERSGDVSFLPK